VRKWGTSIDILINDPPSSRDYGAARSTSGISPLRGARCAIPRGKQGAKRVDPAPYRNAEREAERGMWSLGDKYISPKEWRRMQREVKR
jgi:hypothetical protein